MLENWCEVDLATTSVAPSGKRTIAVATHPANPPIDCFYVYPTVSEEPRANSNLAIQNDEKQVAIIEASRFSQVCRVFAPMYRQVTGVADRYGGGNRALAYDDVLAAWRDYLAHWNHGRGVVLIGHSQGSYVLEQLIQSQLDGTPESKRLVSAILLGGNVVVRDGSETGGTFRHLRLCASATQTDVSIDLTELLGLVRSESASYRGRH